MNLSIRARLTLWFSILMTVALTVFSVGVLWLHARWGRAQFDSELGSIGVAMSRVMQEELSESGNLAKSRGGNAHVDGCARSRDGDSRRQRTADRCSMAWVPVHSDNAHGFRPFASLVSPR